VWNTFTPVTCWNSQRLLIDRRAGAPEIHTISR
jgi:hypothetical protein